MSVAVLIGIALGFLFVPAIVGFSDLADLAARGIDAIRRHEK